MWNKKWKVQNQFSQVKGDLNLQDIPKSIPIPNKKTLQKQMIMIKNKDEKSEKARKKIQYV